MKSLFKIALGIGIGIAGYHYYPQAVQYYHASTAAAVRHTQAEDDALLAAVIKCLESAETPAERQAREVREWKEGEQVRFAELQKAVKDAEAIDIDALQKACDKIAK